MTATIVAISLITATTLFSFHFAGSAIAQKANQSQTSKGSAQNQSAKQSQTNKTKSMNATKPIGNVQQLSKALGNNSKIISNNTNIGNPNAGKAASAQQKVTSPTPKNGLPSNPTKGSGSAASSGGGKANHTSISSGPGKV